MDRAMVSIPVDELQRLQMDLAEARMKLLELSAESEDWRRRVAPQLYRERDRYKAMLEGMVNRSNMVTSYFRHTGEVMASWINELYDRQLEAEALLAARAALNGDKS